MSRWYQPWYAGSRWYVLSAAICGTLLGLGIVLIWSLTT